MALTFLDPAMSSAALLYVVRLHVGYHVGLHVRLHVHRLHVGLHVRLHVGCFHDVRSYVGLHVRLHVGCFHVVRLHFGLLCVLLRLHVCHAHVTACVCVRPRRSWLI